MNTIRVQKNAYAFCLLAVMLAGIPGCNPKYDVPRGETTTPATYSGKYPIQATVTVGMVADLVREIGGERVVVTQLLGAGIDPHLYKPTRDDVQSIMEADIVFYSGLMLEGKMAETLGHVGKTKPSIPVAECLSAAQLGHDPTSHDHPDPHVWMDVSLWSEVAQHIAERLSAFDSPHADEYLQKAATLRKKLDGLHAYGKHVMSGVKEPRVLITSHDAFRYFAKAYRLNVEPVQGISTESEAGLRRINDLVDLIVQRNVRVVFVESSVPPESIEAILRGAASHNHKVEVGGELFSDAMGKDGTYEGTYIGMMDHNLTIIAKALGSDRVPEGGFRKLSSND